MVDIKHPLFQNASATVKFINLIDALFDILNSRNPHGRGYKSSIKKENEFLWSPVFAEAMNYFQNSKTLNGINLLKTRKQTPFKGFIISIKSIIGIYETYILPEGDPLKYLLTYKLSQDHLELFFCSIRYSSSLTHTSYCLQHSMPVTDRNVSHACNFRAVLCHICDNGII